jgi:ABC-type nitrate/sulfonate/bicarbonate transport system ATPase subunit
MSRAGGPAQLDVRIESKSYRSASGGRLDVLRDLKFALQVGAVAALVGPSGCGKTTLLRIITGIDRDFAGAVSLPDHGRLGMVFQEPRLLPWRTVEQNVRLGAPEATDADLDTLFAALGLSAHRNHYPGELSLGQARRVALARAFAVKPDLLVLDEPFVSLDDALVTHNLDEAIGLADRVFLLSSSPTHVIAELPIARPRGHSLAERTAIRAEISRRLGRAAE